MATLFKDIYNQTFFNTLTDALVQVYPSFNKTSFLEKIYAPAWEQMELKQRMRHITTVLKSHLTADFKTNAALLIKLITYLENNGISEQSIEFMFLPDFIEVYGIADYHTAITAFTRITQFTSAEFAVRPFIIKNQAKMMGQMELWAQHPHKMVRRLATEGCRPRLPWAMAIPSFKEDPSPIISILERLKNDPAETVRRSVANNLNDIAKDHPNTVLQLAQNWQGQSKETDWVIKHGCRTLLKQGHTAAMRLFGFGTVDQVQIKKLQINNPTLKIGADLHFSFELYNTANIPLKLRLEYGIFYQKANGHRSKKVFKISEKEYPKNSCSLVKRKQPFKVITTRKLYAGKHQLCIIVNGIAGDPIDFNLLD